MEKRIAFITIRDGIKSCSLEISYPLNSLSFSSYFLINDSFDKYHIILYLCALCKIIFLLLFKIIFYISSSAIDPEKKDLYIFFCQHPISSPINSSFLTTIILFTNFSIILQFFLRFLRCLLVSFSVCFSCLHLTCVRQSLNPFCPFCI